MNLFQQHAPSDMAIALRAIPIIDFGPWFNGDTKALAALADEVRDACERIGFFYLAGHGVIVDGKRDRYSLAYFHSPNPDRSIEVLPSCIDDEHPPRYPPALYADLILEFFRANYAHQQGHGSAPMPNRYA